MGLFLEKFGEGAVIDVLNNIGRGLIGVAGEAIEAKACERVLLEHVGSTFREIGEVARMYPELEAVRHESIPGTARVLEVSPAVRAYSHLEQYVGDASGAIESERAKFLNSDAEKEIARRAIEAARDQADQDLARVVALERENGELRQRIADLEKELKGRKKKATFTCAECGSHRHESPHPIIQKCLGCGQLHVKGAPDLLEAVRALHTVDPESVVSTEDVLAYLEREKS